MALTEPHPDSSRPPAGHQAPEGLNPRPGAALFGRALRRRCPACGRGRMFDGWMRMRRRCESCGFVLERGEEDYFIGAYLLNLIIAELIVVALMLAVLFATWPAVPWQAMLWGIVVLTIPAVVLTYPYSRSLWLATDLLFRPAEPGDYAPDAEVVDLEARRQARERDSRA